MVLRVRHIVAWFPTKIPHTPVNSPPFYSIPSVWCILSDMWNLRLAPAVSYPYNAFPLPQNLSLITYRQPHSALNRENCAIAPQVESLTSRTLLPNAVRCYLTAICLTDRCQCDVSIPSVKGMNEKQRQLDLNSRWSMVKSDQRLLHKGNAAYMQS